MVRQCNKSCMCMVLNGEVIGDECKENYHEESDKGYILEVNVKYSKELHNLHSALAF